MKKKLFFGIITLTLIAGCCVNYKEQSSEDKKIVAKINKYEMTIQDFRNETKSAGPHKAKEDILDELITKKILIQEAQKQNFDKDKAFMKEIERYWEQALLKLLFKKKTAELARSISVDEKEVREEYERMLKEEPGPAEPYEKVAPEIKNSIYHEKIQKELDKWITDLRNKADVKVYKENLKDIEIK